MYCYHGLVIPDVVHLRAGVANVPKIVYPGVGVGNESKLPADLILYLKSDACIIQVHTSRRRQSEVSSDLCLVGANKNLGDFQIRLLQEIFLG